MYLPRVLTASAVTGIISRLRYLYEAEINVRPIKPITMNKEITLSILMPCLNEARTLGTCIAKAKRYLSRQNFAGEIVIADNGSTDGSQKIAESLGVRVLPVSERGYGNALKAGIEVARGKYVIMGDSDDSYDFESL